MAAFFDFFIIVGAIGGWVIWILIFLVWTLGHAAFHCEEHEE